MDLFTRCSHCDTVFRVTTRHLQASGGQVRCGRCEAVFDAFASLTAKPPGEGPELQGNEEQPASLRPASGDHAEAYEPASDSATPALPEMASTESGPEKTELEQTWPPEKGDDETGLVETLPTETAPGGADEILSESQRETDPESDSALAETADSDVAANLYEWEFKPAPRLLARTRLWLGLSVLLALGAFVQAGFVFRTEVLVNVPQARPVYEQVCRWMSCEIGLPRLADQLNIDASDLQIVDPGKPNLVKLTALVRNRARVPVEYPAFELTLTNAREQVVARRVFMPAEYLAGEVQRDTGLPGRQELSVNLYLDTGSLRAAGYRIYLFYPT